MVEPRITEIFSSIQGEGIYAGQPQIFIRFAKCNLACEYCDTVKKGGRKYGVYEVLDAVNMLAADSPVSVVSITGGEPLVYADFLKQLLPCLKKRNFRIYLETNGTLSSGLASVLGYVDVISMDMKLPSSQRKRKGQWTAHRDFLKIAKEKEVFIKIVVTGKTKADEIRKATAIVSDVSDKIPLVLQPVTPANKATKKVPLARVMEFQKMARVILDDVRIIPQIHKQLGVR